MDGESKFILLLGVELTFGVLLIIAGWTLAINLIENQAAIRCAEYNYKCPEEEE